MFSLDVQIYMFTVNVGLGMVLAFLFDGCRVVRSLLIGRRPAAARWMTDALDILFWFLAVPLVIVVWGWGNWGQLRTFTFLGLTAGVVIYAAFGSPTLFPAMVAVLRTMGRAVRATGRWLAVAVPRLARATWRGLRGVAAVPAWPVRLLGRALAVPLRPVWRPLSPPIARSWQRLSAWWQRAWKRVGGFWGAPKGTPPPEAPPSDPPASAAPDGRGPC